jgi:hypothetical protein
LSPAALSSAIQPWEDRAHINVWLIGGAQRAYSRRGSQPITGFELPLDEQNCAFLATVGRKPMRPRAQA